MELFWSAALLGSFVLGVEALLGDDDDIVTRFAGLFTSSERLGWPAGVQEADLERPWLREPSDGGREASASSGTAQLGPTKGRDACRGGGPGDGVRPNVEPTPEIVDRGVPPVPVTRVRPH